jgi:drug/metabolite transporter (DMT)-like permease
MQATASKKYVGLLSGVLCISFSAIFVKLAAVDSTVSAFYRCFYSSIFLFGVALVRGELRSASWRWLVPALWGGLALAADLIIWHKTILYIGAGPATIMANSQVIFVTIFGFFFFKERISPWFPLLIPFIFLGLFLTIPTIQVLVSPGIGFFLGILVGIAYSGYLLGLRFAKMKAGKGYPEILSLAVFMAVTGAFVGTYGAVVEQVDFIVTSWRSQLFLVLMALLSQSMGWILIKTNITQLPSHRGSLLLLIQPMLTMLWGFLLLGEPLGPVQLLGMVLALGLIALYQLRLAPED